jgi:hypothetical protein
MWQRAAEWETTVEVDRFYVVDEAEQGRADACYVRRYWMKDAAMERTDWTKTTRKTKGADDAI